MLGAGCWLLGGGGLAHFDWLGGARYIKPRVAQKPPNRCTQNTEIQNGRPINKKVEMMAVPVIEIAKSWRALCKYFHNSFIAINILVIARVIINIYLFVLTLANFIRFACLDCIVSTFFALANIWSCFFFLALCFFIGHIVWSEISCALLST